MPKPTIYTISFIGLLLVIAAEVTAVLLRFALATTATERHTALLIAAAVYAASALTTALAQFKARTNTVTQSWITAAFLLPSACLAFVVDALR